MTQLGPDLGDDDTNKSGSRKKKKTAAPTTMAEKKQQIDQGEVDLHSIESNMKKIKLLEEALEIFVRIFTQENSDALNETIQDVQRLRFMEKYERFGL